MELIAKISRGSRMDQVYIPKNRTGFDIGNYVVIKPLERKEVLDKLYFYNVKSIEPIKLEIIKDTINVIDKLVNNENIIITGSFIDRGFNFNDIDIIIVSEDKLNEKYIERRIWDKIKIKAQIILISNEELIRGLSQDPLYQMMLSKCIAKRRFIYKVKNKVDYKILDLHLLRSKALIDNFNFLNGNEKYYLIRNMVAISMYLRSRNIKKDRVDKEIKKLFNLKNIIEIKDNMLNRDEFLRRYRDIYKETFNEILKGIEDGSK